MVLADLPEPACNPFIGVPAAVGHVDLALEAYRTLIEYEGDQHRTDAEQWNTDIARAEAFAGDGWRLLRVTAAHARHPRALVLRIYATLQAGGYRGPVPAFSDEWALLFERNARSRRL